MTGHLTLDEKLRYGDQAEDVDLEHRFQVCLRDVANFLNTKNESSVVH